MVSNMQRCKWVKGDNFSSRGHKERSLGGPTQRPTTIGEKIGLKRA